MHIFLSIQLSVFEQLQKFDMDQIYKFDSYAIIKTWKFLISLLKTLHSETQDTAQK